VAYNLELKCRHGGVGRKLEEDLMKRETDEGTESWSEQTVTLQFDNSAP